MAEIAASPLAFEEAIKFLRGKVRIPSRRSDELLGAIHAKAFTVAGATKAELLGDLHQATVKAMSEGQSIGQFRAAFDELVAAHGWSYKGHRNWRTRVIYDTNMRTAHMAGRWEQIQRTKEQRPYLQYLTAGDARVRPQHQAWDETMLPVDDAWWSTHYPPNGWGCRCTVRTLSETQAQREGVSVDQAPAVQLEERVNTRTGEVYGMVPEGIDTGWDYNVGQAWVAPEQTLGRYVAELPPALRGAALDSLASQSDTIAESFTTWAAEAAQDNAPGDHVAGYLSRKMADQVVDRGGSLPTVTITVSADTLRELLVSVARVAPVDHAAADLVQAIPTAIAQPDVVLWDKANARLLVGVRASSPDATSRRASLLLYTIKLAGPNEPTSTIESARFLSSNALRDAGQYEVIQGTL